MEPDNGTVIYNSPPGSDIPGIENGTRATYECKEGHRVNGTVSRQCEVDPDTLQGAWDGVDSQCVGESLLPWLPRCKLQMPVTYFDNLLSM